MPFPGLSFKKYHSPRIFYVSYVARNGGRVWWNGRCVLASTKLYFARHKTSRIDGKIQWWCLIFRFWKCFGNSSLWGVCRERDDLSKLTCEWRKQKILGDVGGVMYYVAGKWWTFCFFVFFIEKKKINADK